MKRIISLTLTLLFVMGTMLVFPVSAESKIITSGDWSYIITEESTAEVLSYNGSETELIVPDELDGYKVTRIRAASSESTSKLCLGKNIEVVSTDFITKSGNIKEITVAAGNKAFSSKNGLLLNGKGNKLVAFPGGKKDKTLSLPDSVKYIGKSSFEGNTNLKKLVIPKNIKYIGAYAFSCCQKLQAVKISKKVETIKNGAFFNCKRLSGIKIENNKRLVMGSFVFSGCDALTETKLTVIKNVKGNGSGMFSDCANLEEFTVSKGVKNIPINCCGDCKALKTVTLPSSVKKIGEAAFDGCTELKSFKITKNIKAIDQEAFYNCKKMKTVTIPPTVKSIGAYAFGYKIIGGEDYSLNPDFVIKGKSGSAAEKYAKANKLKFKAI